MTAIEQGSPGVSFATHIMVLFYLIFEKDLKLIALYDELGRKLQDIGLTFKAR